MKSQVFICIMVSLLGAAISSSEWVSDVVGSEPYGDTIQSEKKGVIQYDDPVQSKMEAPIPQNDDPVLSQATFRHYDNAVQSEMEAAIQEEATVMQRSLAQPLYRYWNGNIRNHYYTTNSADIGTVTPGVVGKYGYVSEGVACYIYTRQYQGSVPLYEYWNGNDHLYTTDATEIGTIRPGTTGKRGYTSYGIAGYCFPRPATGTVALYRYVYFDGRLTDSFYTTNPHEIGTVTVGQVGKQGYRYVRVACYVYP